MFYSPISIYNIPLESIYKISPILMNFVYILIASISMSIWAMFIYSLSLFIKDAKAYHIPIISLIISLIIHVILDYTGNTKYAFRIFLYPLPRRTYTPSIMYFSILCLVVFVISIVGVFVKAEYFKDEI